jgi:hypothetical protein
MELNHHVHTCIHTHTHIHIHKHAPTHRREYAQNSCIHEHTATCIYTHHTHAHTQVAHKTQTDALSQQKACTKFHKSSVMAVFGCNGLRCVMKIILSLSLSLSLFSLRTYQHAGAVHIHTRARKPPGVYQTNEKKLLMLTKHATHVCVDTHGLNAYLCFTQRGHLEYSKASEKALVMLKVRDSGNLREWHDLLTRPTQRVMKYQVPY